MKISLIRAVGFSCLIPTLLLAQKADDVRCAPVQVTVNASFDVAQNGQAVRWASDTSRAAEVPLTIFAANPIYPASALKDKAEGLVETKLLVDKEGGVSNVVVVRSSGRQDLDRAAIEAAKQYRFTPAKLNGKPVSIDVTIPFQFQLTSSLLQQRIAATKLWHLGYRSLVEPGGSDTPGYDELRYPSSLSRPKGPLGPFGMRSMMAGRNLALVESISKVLKEKYGVALTEDTSAVNGEIRFTISESLNGTLELITVALYDEGKHLVTRARVWDNAEYAKSFNESVAEHIAQKTADLLRNGTITQ